MERNWLIRTFQQQILGPVSKQKLIELIQKGSVTSTDEITSGNGYWFTLKEKDLVEKYIHGDLPQSFNPVSEAKSVYVFKKIQDKTTSINASPPNNRITDQLPHDKIALPKADDLEYPDMSSPIIQEEKDAPDITVIAKMPVAAAAVSPISVKAEATQTIMTEMLPKAETAAELNDKAIFPEGADLEYPDLETPPVPEEPIVKAPKSTEAPKVAALTRTPKPRTLQSAAKMDKEDTVIALYERKPKTNIAPIPKAPIEKKAGPETRQVAKDLEKRNDNYLFVIFFVLIVILFGVFFYYREILNKPLPI